MFDYLTHKIRTKSEEVKMATQLPKRIRLCNRLYNVRQVQSGDLNLFGDRAPAINEQDNAPTLNVQSHNGNLSAELNDIVIAFGRLGETLQRCQAAAGTGGGLEAVDYYAKMVILETKDFQAKFEQVFSC